MNILDYEIDVTDRHVCVDLGEPHVCLSSTVLNGGLGLVDRIVNLRVDDGRCCRPEAGLDTPEEVLLDYCRLKQWKRKTVGMMTAASMKSFRVCTCEEGGALVAALVTSGLANARCAGDDADCRDMTFAPDNAGTINMVLLTNLKLTHAAMVEALVVATEAKAFVLRKAGLKSRVSNDWATGTGTDSIAVVCKAQGASVMYCGKHVLVGELIGKSVRQALEESIQWD